MTELQVGDYARYVRTGTVGKVVDVKEREDGRWIQLDSTGLYYHEDYVEKVEKKESKEKEETDIEEVVERIRELKEAFEHVDERVCEGGG
ncbi:DUF2098 domain-containing protein [Methanopyrus kandleri]|uniref:Uncharacterized protein conserved in archaea n=2 Tax=Methanopyrus kandleri TaxID=2320 RepID=Q8TUT5_METKA|nr:DUF2098 domain-containing protein [Methanopyrus kandleri]AAM02881.1 Uncharacterized protein conserved in archaea [Methanopyrus kandleri AV19]HII70888.1 DUF2098 family protein [Methanopyrus kandleri]